MVQKAAIRWIIILIIGGLEDVDFIKHTAMDAVTKKKKKDVTSKWMNEIKD